MAEEPGPQEITQLKTEVHRAQPRQVIQGLPVFPGIKGAMAFSISQCIMCLTLGRTSALNKRLVLLGLLLMVFS